MPRAESREPLLAAQGDEPEQHVESRPPSPRRASGEQQQEQEQVAEHKGEGDGGDVEGGAPHCTIRC